MTNEKMPEWPEKQHFAFISAKDAGATHDFLRYERARADYWEARCRVAVEALEKIARIADMADADEADDALTDVAGEVMMATVSIGPLPPSTEEKRGE